MNHLSLPLPPARLPRRSLAKAGALFLALSLAAQLHAQVGNNNPTGVSGIFNGQITTGCSFDPLTGNVHRSITDVIVAGAVGEYPLALTRTSNSRSAWGNAFGVPGAWRHNYQWSIQVTARGTLQQDIHYNVDFPDGRSETFNYSASDPYYRAAAGVRERMQPWAPTNGNNGVCYLILPDGGKVEFTGTRTLMYDPELIPPYWYEFDLVATAIIDPYGQRTTFTYDAYRRLNRVTEPAGRYLQFYYRTNSGPTIEHVAASDGRTVQYIYGYSAFPPGTTNYLWLGHVVYYGDSTWTAHYKYRAPNVGNANGLPLLLTADDPMYPGPMKRIAYTYRTTNNPDGSTRVYGQISSENYYDGTSVGAAVSTLTIGAAPSNHNLRTETRGDGVTRTFTYGTTGFLNSNTDFMNHSASQGYDANKYINSVTDRNGHTTNFTSNALNGNMTVTTFPLTQDDTPGQTQRPTVQYTYGWANCPDPNNRNANNPYYLYSITDEGGHATIFTRDVNKRITRIDYPDGGYETFSYNGFGQVLTHRMTTGGTESFTYDGRGLKQTYRNPSNAGGNPTARYLYDTLDRVKDVTDALGGSFGDPYHTTSFTYTLRGQIFVTTLPKDPVDGVRRTITNAYNPDGTLASRTNERNQITSYTYDDYRRVRSVTPPVRGINDFTPHTTRLYYDPNGTTDDYKYTDSNVTYVTLPSLKKIKATYDANRRKNDVTVGWGTADAAMTSYGYDNVGNVTRVTNPRNMNTSTSYDERNRPSSVSDAYGNTTTFTYDLAGRRKSVTRPNSQTMTYDTFDAMNRVTQQTVTQAPDPAAVTKYTYYTPADGANAPVGLLKSMKDPRLVALNSSYNYTYAYDAMGRKMSVLYPPDSGGAQRWEAFTYDTAGRLWTFRNRNAKTQTFTYDALHRMTGFSWNDGLTPSVSFGYDIGSRLTSINNANAAISREYYNDNLLRTETETITGGIARTVSYAYDADGNRSQLSFPGYTANYTYTERNQLKTVALGATTLATYAYDANGYTGDLTSRVLNNNTRTDYNYDALDRVTWVTHALNGTTRQFNYGYYPNSNNRKYARRLGTPQGDVGDAFGYDLADQVSGVQLNVATPQNVDPIPRTIIYDANGNRVWFTPYGSNDQYFTNDLNQYTQRNAINAAYDVNGNLSTGLDGSAYTFDAQNRLTSATKGSVTMQFKYDGLNRQVSRTVVGGATTYNVWDGWDLVEEFLAPAAQQPVGAYLHGATGLVKNLVTDRYYYQDGSGSTSHLASNTGNLLWWFRYDLQGAPIVYNSANNQISDSGFDLHLFTGQQWYSQLGLYDLRNRFYSPDTGRFLQPDPIGFAGDPTNLYRYCGNNPVTHSDPSGEKVYISQKPVVGIGSTGGNHTYLVIVPSNPTSFTGAANLFPGRGALTISGQPIGGYLNSTVNSNINSSRNDIRVVQPPPGMTDAQFDDAVYKAATSYPQNTYSYSFLGNYNSNGFTVAVLAVAGVVNAQALVDSLPGLQPGTGYPPAIAPGPFDRNPFEGNIELSLPIGRGGMGGGGGFGGSSLGNFGGFGSGFGGQFGSSSGLMDSNDLGQVHVGQSALDNWLGSSTGDHHIPIWGTGD